MPLWDVPLWELVLIFLALMAGGLLKGATGAGAPILAVPAMAAVYDVQFAIVVMLVPNLLTNLSQAWRYREHRLSKTFLWRFVGGGVIGVLAGTYLLTTLDADVLSLMVGIAVALYVLMRVLRSDWVLSTPVATRIALPMGIISGVLQGAAGLSAPASLSFLNALRLERLVFMSTISLLFVTFVIVQFPVLSLAGVVTPQGLLVSCLAMIPIFAGMPVGAFLARHLSRPVFDRAIMLLLALLAAKMLFDSLF